MSGQRLVRDDRSARLPGLYDQVDAVRAGRPAPPMTTGWLIGWPGTS